MPDAHESLDLETPATSRGVSATRSLPSGIPLVVGLLVLAVGLALFAVWFQWRQTRRCLDFYGATTAAAVQRAPRVELWERRSQGPEAVALLDRLDVTRARGLVHLRRGLVEDANFDWDAAVPAVSESSDEPIRDLALAFFDGVEAENPLAVLLIDRHAGAAGTLAVRGQPGHIGLGRLRAGLDAWLASARADSAPVGQGDGRPARTSENRAR